MIRGGRRIVACLLIASLTLTTGCSFTFVRRPKKVAPGHYEAGNCTSSRIAPAIDTILLVVQGGRLVQALGQNDEDYRGMAISRDGEITAGATLAAIAAVSAFYGYATAAQCRALRPGESSRGPANPYQRPEQKQTRVERAAEEAAEEAAVQARANARAAEDAQAAGEAARRARAGPTAAPAAKP